MIREAIAKIVTGAHLSESESYSVMDQIMTGQATPSQIAAFITALRMKGETVDEIVGCARAMRERATRINPRTSTVVDTCGTGGDGADTFNISTTAALVAAGAGCSIAKHGGRAVSSRCGSADVLEGLGVRLELRPEDVERCIDDIGIGFMYAPAFHGAMRHAVTPRREVGIRTIFNILGPLTNPAGARVQVVGVYEARLTPIMAEVLGRLGAEEAWVVHGLGGLDEISLCDSTQVSHWVDGRVETFRLDPEEYGFRRVDRDALRGGSVEENVRLTEAILKGETGPRRDVVVLNAAAALLVGRRAESFREGIELARRALDTGAAQERLDSLREFTRSCA